MWGPQLALAKHDIHATLDSDASLHLIGILRLLASSIQVDEPERLALTAVFAEEADRKSPTELSSSIRVDEPERLALTAVFEEADRKSPT